MRRAMGRGLRILGVAAFVLLVLQLAQVDAIVTAAAVSGLAISALLWWWLSRPDAAASVAILVVALVLTSEITYWVGSRVESVSPLQLGIAFWIFAGVVAAATWLAPRHRGSRAVTVAMAEGILVLASFGAYLAPGAIPVLGFAIAIGLVVWRSRRRRWRARPYEDGVAARSRGADRTYEEIKAADGVTVLGPQEVGRRKVEQLAQAGPITYVVETRHWDGSVELVDVEGATKAYALDGDPTALTARLAPITETIHAVRQEQGGDVQGIVTFWDDTTLEGRKVELDIVGSRHRTTRITLVRGEILRDVLQGS